MASYHPGRASIVIDEATRLVLEPLESRTLLSASLNNGTLNIVGTDAPDNIRMRITKDGGLLQVRINGQVGLFHKADVSAINIDAKARKIRSTEFIAIDARQDTGASLFCNSRSTSFDRSLNKRSWPSSKFRARWSMTHNVPTGLPSPRESGAPA